MNIRPNVQRTQGQPESGVGFPTPPTHSSMPDWYPDLLATVAQHVATGQQRAIAAANQHLLTTYWKVGHEILERQNAEGWGAKVIDRLSADLREQFPDSRGFSPRNLKYMRAFAAAWPDVTIVQGSLAQLPWYHQIALLEKLSDRDQRLWYASAAIAARWSRDVLTHQIEARLHERSGNAITNFTSTMPPHDSDQAQQATRDPYLFDFVGNADIRRERDLERGLVAHVEKFLLELGQGFAFIGKQVRLEIDGQEFFADLVFYHIRLRCHVVIELKAADFEPRFLGQVGMYMAAIDDVLAQPGDKPTIGLVLCKSKSDVAAEYALRGYNVPIGVAEWTTTLTSSLPPDLATSLPTIEELEAELADADEKP